MSIVGILSIALYKVRTDAVRGLRGFAFGQSVLYIWEIFNYERTHNTAVDVPTSRHAGPDILIIAIAARPGADARAYMVDESLNVVSDLCCRIVVDNDGKN